MKSLLVVHHNVCDWCCITNSPIVGCKLCPKCGMQITDNTSRCTVLPNPFLSTNTGYCCIVLKPSTNSFIKYKLGDNLHIGLSNSKGFVFSYTMDGIIVESFWDDCICIYRFDDSEMCDKMMKMFVRRCCSQFSRQHYDKRNWNCYDFVVEFLVDIGVLKRATCAKEQFVAEYVCKALQRVLRYCSLLNRLSQSKIWQKVWKEAEIWIATRRWIHWVTPENRLPEAEILNGLYLRIESMLEIFKTLKIVKEDNRDEFNLYNVPLPDFDAADIELLFGKEFTLTKLAHKNGLSKFKDRLREQIMENIRMAKILLEEYNEIVPLYREKVLQNMRL